MHESDIHFIIVTYNGDAFIRKCIESIRLHSSESKIHIIDNGSTDDTLNILQELNQPFVSTNKNLGFGQANNIGIHTAINEGAKFLFLLNQDAYVQPNCTSNFLQLDHIHEDCMYAPVQLNGDGSKLDEVFYTRCLRWDSCYPFLEDVYFNRTKATYSMQYANATAWIGSSTLFQNIGGFNPSFFHYGEDDNFIDRLHHHNYSIRLLAHSFVHHDREDHSRGHYWEEREHQKRKFIRKLSHPNSAPVKKIIRTAQIQYFKKRMRGHRKNNIIEHHQLEAARHIGIDHIENNQLLSTTLNGPFLTKTI